MQSLTLLKRTAENIKDPLFRFFEREVNHGATLLRDVRSDLQNVVLACEGKKKQTNHDRELIGDLAKGILPKSWNRYTVPAGLTVIQWVSDFSERVKQLQKIATAASSGGAKELKVIHSTGDACDTNYIKPWTVSEPLTGARHVPLKPSKTVLD